MERKELALYTTLSVLLIETVVIAWVYWKKDKKPNEEKENP